jgi:heme/copper-type cytochrome/quinol oxidase subunit 2
MDGWDWLWMTFIMGLWLVVIGVVVYVAVWLARRPPPAGHP